MAPAELFVHLSAAGRSAEKTASSEPAAAGETPEAAQATGGLKDEMLPIGEAVPQGELHLEGLVLVKYDEGDYFREHHDGKFRPKTVLLYLNGVEEGGYTHFTRLGLQIAPAEGCGAVWGNVTPAGCMDVRTLHAGAPPVKGTKYVVNCFFNEAVIRAVQPQPPLASPAAAPAAAAEQNSNGGVGKEEEENAFVYRRREHTERQLFLESRTLLRSQHALPPAAAAADVALQPPQQQQPPTAAPAAAAAAPQMGWGASFLQMLQQLGLPQVAAPAPAAGASAAATAAAAPPLVEQQPKYTRMFPASSAFAVGGLGWQVRSQFGHPLQHARGGLVGGLAAPTAARGSYLPLSAPPSAS
ncbi:hypothetical protein Efla_005878 [Eimeria flavescens]